MLGKVMFGLLCCIFVAFSFVVPIFYMIAKEEEREKEACRIINKNFEEIGKKYPVELMDSVL